MSNKYPLIAAAVAAAFAAGYADAAVPTLAQAAAPAASLVMSGSSAAQSAVQTAISADLCGGAANTLVVASKGGSGNFLAFSCFTSTAIAGTPGIAAGSLVTVYYRTEGGSVVGALPIASGHQILRLNLGDTTNCTQPGGVGTITCTVSGTTSTSGTTDSWTGAVKLDTVQLGVTDVEPALLVGSDYPTAYSPAAFGTATSAQMAALTTSKLFQQAFGLVVNTSGGTFTAVNLTKESAANIELGNYSDWSAVPDAFTGNPISSAGAHITLVDREPGSGTRTSTNVYLFGAHCGGSGTIPSTRGGNFSTGDELNAANATAGAIAYASIDQILNPANKTKWTNLALATINGVTPSTTAAATGQYDFWYEATLVPNPAVGANTAAGNLIAFLQADLPKLATAPAVPDINVIPGQGNPKNVAHVPLTSNGKTGTAQIFVNPYTRGTSSCNVPAETN
jgi:hypothetical protein